LRWLCLLLLSFPAFAQNCPEVDREAQRRGEAECRAKGGEWARFGVHAHLCNVYSCAPRTRDGGKPCTTSRECEYQCVSRKELPPGAEATGECVGVVSPFGCRYPVEGGRIAGRICID